ncbi:hypothetical protein EDB80DRAFT_33891 [Ilyonectria destructans]|nr:hypothetical protein EDB80DRAFT_33891 [Ilyonectria destructans]
MGARHSSMPLKVIVALGENWRAPYRSAPGPPPMAQCHVQRPSALRERLLRQVRAELTKYRHRACGLRECLETMPHQRWNGSWRGSCSASLLVWASSCSMRMDTSFFQQRKELAASARCCVSNMHDASGVSTAGPAVLSELIRLTLVGCKGLVQ